MRIDQRQTGLVFSLEMNVEKLLAVRALSFVEAIFAQLLDERCVAGKTEKSLQNDFGELLRVPDDEPTAIGRPLYYARVSVALQ